jgi:hypothetical protein
MELRQHPFNNGCWYHPLLKESSDNSQMLRNVFYNDFLEKKNIAKIMATTTKI